MAIEPFLNAYGSMWATVFIVLPALFFVPMKSEPAIAIGAVIVIGVLCSGVAYLLYFRLIEDVGATSALNATFLIPIFGTLWGVMFLDEKLSMTTLAGMAVIIISTAMVTKFNPKQLFMRNRGA